MKKFFASGALERVAKLLVAQPFPPPLARQSRELRRGTP